MEFFIRLEKVASICRQLLCFKGLPEKIWLKSIDTEEEYEQEIIERFDDANAGSSQIDYTKSYEYVPLPDQLCVALWKDKEHW